LSPVINSIEKPVSAMSVTGDNLSTKVFEEAGRKSFLNMSAMVLWNSLIKHLKPFKKSLKTAQIMLFFEHFSHQKRPKMPEIM
jgi:hypothetical protein